MPSGATILGCEGPRLSTDESAFFREADPFGFILFGRNVETPDQLRALTRDLRAAVGRDAPILVDQEGGRVQRLRAPHWREWLPPLDQMARVAPENAARAMTLRFRAIAEELRAVGIDANCAPVADIASDLTHPFLRNRCYGTELATVIAASRAAAEGMLAGGVLPVMKHMPGHGRASADTHLHLPRVSLAREDLMASDFAAFAALADLPMGMTAHIIFTDIDPDAPATQSAEVIRLIRDEIGFDGLLMTDDLSMEALQGPLDQRAARSIAAGCDIALHCSGKRSEMEGVVAAAGAMSAQAQRRGAAALERRLVALPVDMAEIDAQLREILSGTAHG